MTDIDSLGYFFETLTRLLNEARLSPRRLSMEIGRRCDYVSDLLHHRRPPDLEAVYAMADVLNVDVADMLRPGPAFGHIAEKAGDHWAERLAEKVLGSALRESRRELSIEAPTFDAVLNWWHANGGLLTNTEKLDQHVEIFSEPDTAQMRPVPKRMGRNSLAARELGISSVEQLDRIFEESEPAVGRRVALAHADVVQGQPKISFHTILIDMSSGRIVRLSYVRLLLPVRDGDGQRFVLNYSKPVRRDEIGREGVGEFETIHRGQPMLAGMN